LLDIASERDALENSEPRLTEEQDFRLRKVLKEMPSHVIHRLADKYEVEIPPEAVDIYEIVDGFVDEASIETKKEILSQYGDAGKVSSFVFMSREKTPLIQTVYPKAKTLTEYKPESMLWESYPYYDEVEVDHPTRTLRIRFHYLRGSIPLIDESTGRPREVRQYWQGAVVFRPESKMLEIRTKHPSMARKLAARIPASLGLEPFYSLNLMDEKMNKRFIEWIKSLNSATIELPITEVSGCLVITARKGMDLRTAKRYQDELRFGRLRHGHVTIEPEEGNKINFHIYFRNCHIKYTLLTSESDIDYVVEALERIFEGHEFEKPEALLRYLGKGT
jgi:hypothetical protein